MGLWQFFGPPKPPPRPSTPEDTSTQYAILHSNRGWRATARIWRSQYEWIPGRWVPRGWESSDLTAEGWPVPAGKTCILPTREAAAAAIETHRSGASTWRVMDSIT